MVKNRGESMYYIKTLFFNFLVVFFADHILPGIEVMNQTKLPHVGGDLLFAAGLGLLNSLIFPLLKLVKQQPTALRIALIALIMNFLAYAIVKLLPVGIHITSVEGYLLVSLGVTLGSFLINFLEMKHYKSSCGPSGPDFPQ